MLQCTYFVTFCYIIATICYIVATLLLHCCYPSVTLLIPFVTLLLQNFYRFCHTFATCFTTGFATTLLYLLLHSCYLFCLLCYNAILWNMYRDYHASSFLVHYFPLFVHLIHHNTISKTRQCIILKERQGCLGGWNSLRTLNFWPK